MSGAAATQFSGPVQVDRRAGGALLVLRGTERGSGVPLAVSFSGPQSASLPAALRDLAIDEAGNAPGAALRRWQLRSAAGDVLIEARAIHVQRDVSAAFAAAVPPCRASAASRGGWAALLNLLRVPGALRVLQRLRSRAS